MKQEHERLLKRLGDMQYAVRFKKNLDPFHDVQKEYPQLYAMILSNEDPSALEKVRYMLCIMERMESQELTSHQADVLVGQRFAQEYIDPLVKKKS